MTRLGHVPDGYHGRDIVSRQSALAAAMATLTIVVTAAVLLWLMGRVPMCTCGTVKVWHGVVNSSENSQHLSDWYTFSHVIHGFGVYALLWVAARRLPVRWRFVIAVVLEATWEVVENTPMVIDRYRAATIALDYYGDSIVNSLSDLAAMMAGFALAYRLPILGVLGSAMVMEAVAGAMIRDNLTLNILMLVYPLDAVKQWQMGR